MKKLGKFRVKYLRFCKKIMKSKYAHKIPRFIQCDVLLHKAKADIFNYDANRYICPFCHAFIKYRNDCKACGAVNVIRWWCRR